MADAGPQPDCAKCESAYLATLPFPKNLMSRMIVCSMCGNKRCPRAADHDLHCTGSNEPGQVAQGVHAHQNMNLGRAVVLGQAGSGENPGRVRVTDSTPANAATVSVSLDELRLNVRRMERATEAGNGQHVGVVVALRSLRKMIGEAEDD